MDGKCPPPRSGAAGCAIVLVSAVLAAVAGCSASAPAKPGAASPAASTSQALPSCGTARTAVDVPVLVKVDKGSVPCPSALAVERAYAAAVRAGKAPGNGGGGPVSVDGWVCQGFNTPQVLATGDASECTKGATKILAVLPAPSATPTST